MKSIDEAEAQARLDEILEEAQRQQQVGLRQTDEHIWLVTFMDYDLGYFDDETCRLEPIDNPFGPKLLPMSSE